MAKQILYIKRPSYHDYSYEYDDTKYHADDVESQVQQSYDETDDIVETLESLKEKGIITSFTFDGVYDGESEIVFEY